MMKHKQNLVLNNLNRYLTRLKIELGELENIDKEENLYIRFSILTIEDQIEEIKEAIEYVENLYISK